MEVYLTKPTKLMKNQILIDYIDQLHHNRDHYSKSKLLELIKEKIEAVVEDNKPKTSILHDLYANKYDCDDCKHYPCHIVAKKLYGTCRDHSKRFEN